jgi:protein-disulfide isomerase
MIAGYRTKEIGDMEEFAVARPQRRSARWMALGALLVTGLVAGALLVGASMPAQAAAGVTAAQDPTATPVPATATESATEAPSEESTAATAEPAAEATEFPLIFDSELGLDELESYNGIPVGFTVAGHPFMGDPAAPVVMFEFSDFLCPFCGRHFVETNPLLINEYVLTGKLQIVFYDFPIPSLHPTAPPGHLAARCVGEQGAAAYWGFHDALFARQGEWNRLPDPQEWLLSVAEENGVDMDALAECLTDGRTGPIVEADMQLGGELGFNGTPSFRFLDKQNRNTIDIIGAYPMERFQQVIEALALGEAAPPEPTPEPPQLPYWADEGLAVDEENPGLTVAGDPYKGSADAPVTIVIFSDFQCPACGTHATEVQATLDEQFVESGQVRFVFKNFPLQMHPNAPAAAAAGQCAADQGLFWEMHDALFAGQSAWAGLPADEIDAALLEIAGGVELADADAFAVCLASRQALEAVLGDLYDGMGIIDSTPTFVALYNGTGTLVSGSRPAEEFVTLVEGLLQAAAGE